jgi:SAUR family protein
MGKFGKQLQKLQHTIGHHKKDVKFGDDNIVPSDVPKGSLAVCVGDERQRFVIKAEILKHEVFRVLLAKTAEEFGYKHDGGLIIACDVAFFEYLLWLVETKSPAICHMNLQDYSAFTRSETTYHVVE